MSLEPSLSEVVRDALNARLELVHKAKVGRVVKFDATLGTVDVSPVVQTPIEDRAGNLTHEQIAVIPDVPVLWPRAGGFFVYLPIAVGDHVLLVFPDESIGTWRETGSTSVPGDLRRHSLGSAVAIPGMVSVLTPLLDPPSPSMPANEAVLGGGVYRVGALPTAVPVALAPYVESALTALQTQITALATGLTGVAAACLPLPVAPVPATAIAATASAAVTAGGTALSSAFMTIPALMLKSA